MKTMASHFFDGRGNIEIIIFKFVVLGDAGPNVIKLFYNSNLLPFHGYTVILCYKATLPS